MKKDTTTITLSNGDEIVLNSYITFGEKRELNDIYFLEAEDLTVEERKGKARLAHIQNLVQETALKMIIVSVNGKVHGTDGFDVLAYVSALRIDEGKELIKVINEVVEGGKKTQ